MIIVKSLFITIICASAVGYLRRDSNFRQPKSIIAVVVVLGMAVLAVFS